MASWFSLGRRYRGRRGRPKLLTSVGWYALLAAMAIATGAAIGFVK